MREIKFRAWNPLTLSWWAWRPPMIEMRPPFEIYKLKDDDNNLIIEQFTGLREHNIGGWYCGDIITDGKRAYLIEWSDNELTWILTNPTMRGSVRLSDINSRLWHKVGNIHENPELLEQRE